MEKQIIKKEGITTDQLKGLSKNLWISFLKRKISILQFYQKLNFFKMMFKMHQTPI